jgi:hypothetical protein
MSWELARTKVAVGRRLGASPQARARQIDYNSQQVWVGICRDCKATVKGTPAQLKKHVCLEVHDGR